MITVGEVREKLEEWGDHVPMYLAVTNPATASGDEEPNLVEFEADDIDHSVDKDKQICVVITVPM